MEDVVVPIFVCGILFVGMPWIILHYVTRWKTAPKITNEDEKLLDELYSLARRLEDRLGTVERIIAADHPEWRASMPLAEPATDYTPNTEELEMSASRTKFYLDKQNGKVLGVCAGIADYTGIDVTMVRVAVVILTLMTSGWVIPAYFITNWVAPTKPVGLYDSADDAKFWQGVRTNPTRSTAEVRSKFRDIDRRLADIETMYTSRNTRLADEIDSLR